MDFFDKMKDGISKGIDTIGAKGKELMEDTQTQLQFSSLRDKRKKALEDLGALAYALFQKGALADEGAKEVCETSPTWTSRSRPSRRSSKVTRSQARGRPPGAALVKCDCGAEIATGVNFCSVLREENRLTPGPSCSPSSPPASRRW